MNIINIIQLISQANNVSFGSLSYLTPLGKAAAFLTRAVLATSAVMVK
jgi:hypothetical protein